MIHLLIGENDWAARQYISKLTSEQKLRPERFDGENMQMNQLADLAVGINLFNEKRLVVIRDLSLNKSLWSELSNYESRFSDNTTIVILEHKLDKRTAAYKWLQKNAKVINCDYFKGSQQAQARSWLRSIAKEQKINLSPDIISEMIERAIRPSDIDERPIIDQDLLFTALSQLISSSDEITTELLDAVMAPPSHDNVFALITTALTGDISGLKQMLQRLKVTEDGHKVFGLVSSQAVTVLALVLAQGKPIDQVAKDIGAHPFAVRQLSRDISGISKDSAERLVRCLANADLRLKRGQGEIWQMLEMVLLQVSDK